MAKPIPHVDVALAGDKLATQDWYDFFREAAVLLAELAAVPPVVIPPIPPFPIPITPVNLTYGPTINIDAALSSNFILTCTDTSAFTIAAPTNPVPGAVINLTVRNTAGGNLGAVTWNAVFKVPTVPPSWKPPNGSNRSLQFFFDGTNWVQRYAGTEDVPN